MKLIVSESEEATEPISTAEVARPVKAVPQRRPPFSALPDTPLVKVEASQKTRLPLDLRGLWAYRELLYFLTWRDIKVRYKQTLIGATWAILQPLFTMLVFTIFFGILIGVPSDGVPYPLFAYAGLLPWTFFANAVTNSSNSLIVNSNLISKVYFPRIMIPAAAVAAGLMDLVIASVILIGLAFYYRVTLTWGILLLPFFVLLTTLLALGLGICVSALNVKYRDVRHALPFILQSWMFMTPIIYPASVVPAQFQWALALNPMTGIVEGFRAALYGGSLNPTAIAISVALTFLLLVGSAYVFKRIERVVVDFI
ncbi:MAG: ABC transporter permease [Pyrinomonadaceae bacterium]